MENTLIQVSAAGLLFIGDPHVSSRKPGTRNDVKFVDTVIGKIEQAADIANTHDLQPIFIGDLLDRDQETSPYLNVRLIRVLKRFKYKPFELMGNHEINETTLTEDTTLAVLREAEVVRVIEQDGIFLLLTRPDGSTTAVGGTPYGHTIPEHVEATADSVIWCTHDDLAFEGAYPGAKELFEIPGCDLVVNGHMHLTKPIITTGMTRWFNPGNITRQSKDTAEHVPSVWQVTCGKSAPIQHRLRYQEKIFDAVESFVEPAQQEKIPTSEFVKLLKTYAESDIAKTEDGSVLAADIQTLFEHKKVSQGAVSTIMALHAGVTAYN